MLDDRDRRHLFVGLHHQTLEGRTDALDHVLVGLHVRAVVGEDAAAVEHPAPLGLVEVDGVESQELVVFLGQQPDQLVALGDGPRPLLDQHHLGGALDPHDMGLWVFVAEVDQGVCGRLNDAIGS